MSWNKNGIANDKITKARSYQMSETDLEQKLGISLAQKHMLITLNILSHVYGLDVWNSQKGQQDQSVRKQLFNVTNKNTRLMYRMLRWICSRLTIKKPISINWHHQSCVFIVDFEHIQQINLIFSMLIMIYIFFCMVELTIITPFMSMLHSVNLVRDKEKWGKTLFLLDCIWKTILREE